MNALELLLGLAAGIALAGAAGFVLLRQARALALAESAREAEQELATLREQVRARDDELTRQRAAVVERDRLLARERDRVLELSRETATAQAAIQAAEGLRAQLAQADERTDALRAQLARLAAEHAGALSDLENERKAAVERAREAAEQKQALRLEFENLANRLLEEKGKALSTENKATLETVLLPLRERIKEFEDKVARTYDQDNRDRASLLEHLRRLDEAQARLNQEAATLSRALSGESKVQGDWGEMILSNLLELAGLEEGREYFTQESHTTEEGARVRPDVVVYLPGNKAVVVDSKVAITAFIDYTRAEDDEAREAALAGHLAAVRAHVKSLASKRYQDVLKTRKLDFQVMFIPSEAAFQAVVARQPAVYNEAFKDGIILASPTTLLATLRVVALVWQYEKQNSNALRIAEEAGKLLEKFVGFAADLSEVGERLDQARGAFDSAKGKLDTAPGNLAGRARRLLELGARVSKSDKVQDYLAEVGAEVPALGARASRPPE